MAYKYFTLSDNLWEDSRVLPGNQSFNLNIHLVSKLILSQLHKKEMKIGGKMG